MRLLPREHGATVIWLSSFLLALATLRDPPSAIGLLVFVAVSVLALVLLGRLTSSSAVLVRLERNRILLPVLSSLLTLVVPFGHVVMVGQLSLASLAVWLVFLTYTATGVVYTRDAVRAVLKEAAPAWASVLLSAVIVGIEVVWLSAVGWLPIVALAVVAPLLVHRLAVLSPSQRKASLRGVRIRRVGFAQAANMIAAAVILAVASRL